MDLTDPTTIALVAGGTLLLVAIAVTTGLTRRRLNRQRRSSQEAIAAKLTELDGLIDRVMAGSLDAYREMLGTDNSKNDWYYFVRDRYDQELSGRYEAAMSHGARLSNYETTHGRAFELLRDYRGSTASESKVTCLVRLFGVMGKATHGNAARIYEALGISQEGLMANLNQAITSRFDELYAAAHGGGDDAKVAFLLLSALIDDTRPQTGYGDGGQFDGLKVTSLTRPDGWNELVVRHVENPGITLFEREAVARGDILHLAAKAERSGSLVEMLLALAYHNRDRQCSEIPDALVTSLIRKVVALRASAKQATEN